MTDDRFNNVQVNSDSLKKILGFADKVIEKKTTLPIISNVQVRSEKGTLFFTATDLEIAYRNNLTVNHFTGGEEWDLTVPVKDFKKIVDSICKKKQDSIELKPVLQDGKLPVLRVDKYKITGLSSDDYPTIDNEIKQAKLIKCPIEAIEFCKPAMSKDETMYYLNGLAFTDNCLVATDGHRLHMVKTNPKEYNGKKENKNSRIIPSKAIKLLTMAMFKKEFTETIVASEDMKQKYCRLPLGEAGELLVRLIDDEFPDFTQVIPKNNNQTVMAEKQEFINIFSDAKVVLENKPGRQGVKVMAQKGQGVQFEAWGLDSETSYKNHFDENNCEFDGDSLEIGLNGFYVLETLSALVSADKSDAIAMSFDDELGPCRVDHSDSAAILDYTAVIMPMRL